MSLLQSLKSEFLKPPDEGNLEVRRGDELLVKAKKRASVYDAVAGRISSTGFIAKTQFVSKKRDTTSSNTLPIPPEDVLLGRKGAPDLDEIRPGDTSTDFYERKYWADERLAADQHLPDSDLLKAIHIYAADFYNRATIEKGLKDFRSMDGTALLALGILLEEKANEELGEAGDMVFVEGEEEDRFTGAAPGLTRRFQDHAVARGKGYVSTDPEDTRSQKRRRLNEHAD
ncbi:MAG: hypothetical protein MMC33_000476 [Icmadophila ericetorum]|nr:hypothetical protein [Icmadophila ericetorum]